MVLVFIVDFDNGFRLFIFVALVDIFVRNDSNAPDSTLYNSHCDIICLSLAVHED